jgi:hypothetical protein
MTSLSITIQCYEAMKESSEISVAGASLPLSIWSRSVKSENGGVADLFLEHARGGYLFYKIRGDASQGSADRGQRTDCRRYAQSMF